MKGVFCGLASALAAAAAVLIGPNSASSDEPFYEGKTVTWIVGAEPGGSYGLYARTLLPYLQKYIRGNPEIVIRHEPEDGGRRAAAHVHNDAAKDGTVICMTPQNIPLLQLLQPGAARFDVFKWNWIGNMATVRNVLAFRHDAPAATIKDAKKAELRLGATDKTSKSYMNPTLANSLLGTRFKIITGYDGTRSLIKAMERGDIHGFAASGLSIKMDAGEWVDEKKVVFAVQDGLDADPDFPNVPLMWMLGATKLDQEVMKLVATTSRYGRALWMPPGVPLDRLETVRKAFDATVVDPDFLEEARKRRLPIEPASAGDLSALTRALAATDPETVSAARRALRLNGANSGNDADGTP